MDWEKSKKCESGAIVLHTSPRTVTVRCGDRVCKFFLSADEGAVRQEAMLLREFGGIDSEITYDVEAGCWCSSTPYIPMTPMFRAPHPFRVCWDILSALTSWRSTAESFPDIQRNWETAACQQMIADLYAWSPFFPDDAIDFLRNSHSECFIHGDLTLSNMGYDDQKHLVVLDFENAGYGPYRWDETTFVYSLIEHGRIAEARFTFLFFRCSYEMLACIAAVRLSRAHKKNEGIQRRERALRDVVQYFSDYKNVDIKEGSQVF